jgi:hypothetical protein
MIHQTECVAVDRGYEVLSCGITANVKIKTWLAEYPNIVLKVTAVCIKVGTTQK